MLSLLLSGIVSSKIEAKESLYPTIFREYGARRHGEHGDKISFRSSLLHHSITPSLSSRGIVSRQVEAREFTPCLKLILSNPSPALNPGAAIFAS